MVQQIQNFPAPATMNLHTDFFRVHRLLSLRRKVGIDRSSIWVGGVVVQWVKAFLGAPAFHLAVSGFNSHLCFRSRFLLM